MVDPNVSNQVTQTHSYYQRQSVGIFYQNLRDERALDNSYYFGHSDYMLEQRNFSKPIRKVYINFDKDIAHKMFGYRVRFIEDDMAMYAKTGTPSSWASQAHKPIHFYQKDRMKHVLDRYLTLDGYHSKQTIIKVLDSDNEDDLEEIEKNQRAIQKSKLNSSNQNPKIKKRYSNLTWYYGLDSRWDDHHRPLSSYQGNSKSQLILKRHRNSQYTTRFTNNAFR